MKINLSKIAGAFFALFVITAVPCAADDVPQAEGEIFDEILADTGDDFEKIVGESGGRLSAGCDVRVYETLREVYYVCDVTVADSYVSFDGNSCLNLGGSYEVFGEEALSGETNTAQGDAKSYEVKYNVIPTIRYVYVKKDGDWRHVLTAADYATAEYNSWCFSGEDDNDSLVRENSRVSGFDDPDYRDAAAIDAYDFGDVITDLPKKCVIELKGGRYDFGMLSLELNLPGTAAELYECTKSSRGEVSGLSVMLMSEEDEGVSQDEILAEILADTGDDFAKIVGEAGAYLSVECDVDVYETLRKTYHVCDVTVTDTYSSFKKKRYINVGGSYEFFDNEKPVKNGSLSVNQENYREIGKSYNVRYIIYPTVHFVYVKTDENWRHVLTTADYRTTEFNTWYFSHEDDHGVLDLENTYVSDLSDKHLRDSAAMDAYELDDIIIDLPEKCVIDLKGGEYDFGSFSVELSLPANASELYNRVKGPTPVAVWVFAGLAFVCAVGFLPLVIDKYRRRKYLRGEYAVFRYNPEDGGEESDSGEE